jgi:GNAT superfamily N-acetyltransferase
MGVRPDLHRQGYGRALVAAAVAHARGEGRSVLQVKTLGPSHPHAGYARTRRFYECAGSVPMEGTTAFWGPANPCLIMAMSL